MPQKGLVINPPVEAFGYFVTPLAAKYFLTGCTGSFVDFKGGLKRSEMEPEQRDEDTVARMQISPELGHGRIDVIAKYIGS